MVTNCDDAGKAVDRDMDQLRSLVQTLQDTLNQVLCGKSAVVEQVMACLLARGHLLIEDLPGLGKTTLAKGIARAIGGTFSRVQCTPDLLPSDITGFSLFNQATRQFDFQPGPVFSDVLLADEINRATPRTQSALFEAMAERQVTYDRVTHRLSPSFFVIATQNPIESQGAYPLPEAQLDRFAMKVSIGYPNASSELQMLGDAIRPQMADRSDIQPALTLAQLHAAQRHVAGIPVHHHVRCYLIALATATREHPGIHWGVSPRGVLLWQNLAQAHAFLAGRNFVIPDDVQALARPTLAVRIVGDGDNQDTIIEEVLQNVAVPV